MQQLGAAYRFIRRGRPQTNGCVERFQGTVLEECWKPCFARSLVPGRETLERDLERYLLYHNAERAHLGRWIRGRMPAQVVGAIKRYSRR